MDAPITRSGRLTRTGLLILAAAALTAGCGSQLATTSSAAQRASTSSPSPGPAGPGAGRAALCSKAGEVTRLVVSRISALPQNHLHFAFPAGITVTSPPRARTVATAVCGLPAMPHVVMNCPADLGLSYRLSFAAGTRSFPVVTVAAGGCGGVAGAGPVRSADRSPGFWPVLSHALGISTGALRGASPASPHTSPHTSPLRAGPSPAG